MITLRRAEERRHDRTHEWDVWLTSFPQEPAGPLDGGFAALETLAESRLSPRASVAHHSCFDAEVLTFVREGTLAWEDSTGDSGIVRAGEFRRTSGGRGIRRRETNASATHAAHVFHIRLRPLPTGLEPSYQLKRFTAAERRGTLCLVGSPDGRLGSLSIFQDVLVLSALLDRGSHVAYGLPPGRSAWLHIMLGEASLGDLVLGAGDGVGLTSEFVVSLTARQETEVLLLDLGPGGDSTWLPQSSS